MGWGVAWGVVFQRRLSLGGFDGCGSFDAGRSLRFRSGTMRNTLKARPVANTMDVPVFRSMAFHRPRLNGSANFSCDHLRGPAERRLRHAVTVLRNNVGNFTFSDKRTTGVSIFSLLGINSRVVVSSSVCNNARHVIGSIFNGCNVRRADISLNSLSTIGTTVGPGAGVVFVRAPAGPIVGITSVRRLSGVTGRVNTLAIISGAFLAPCFRGPLGLNTSVIARSSAGCLNKRGSAVSNVIIIHSGRRLMGGVHVRVGSRNDRLTPVSS